MVFDFRLTGQNSWGSAEFGAGNAPISKGAMLRTRTTGRNHGNIGWDAIFRPHRPDGSPHPILNVSVAIPIHGRHQDASKTPWDEKMAQWDTCPTMTVSED